MRNPFALTFCFVLGACGSKPADVVSEWRKNAVGGVAEAGVAAKAGSIAQSESTILYAMPDGSVITQAELRVLAAGEKELVLKKALLRRLVIEKGMRESVFSDREAVRFLLPRLEQAMEEYYVMRKSGGQEKEDLLRERAEGGANPAARQRAAAAVLEAYRQKARVLLYEEMLRENPIVMVREGL